MRTSLLEKIIGALAVFVIFAVIVFVIAALVAYPFMWLWNGCLVGTVAGVGPIVGFWHSWGILILCSLIFKSTSSSKSKD